MLISRVRRLFNQRNDWDKDQRNGLDEHIAKLLDQLIVLFGGGGSSGGGSSSGGGGSAMSNWLSPRIFLYLALLLCGLFLLGGFYTVDAREQVVILRLGKFHEVRGEGLNWRILFVDQLHRENTTQVRSYSHQAVVLTGDQNIVRVPITVQYVIGDIKDFVLNVREPEGALRLAAESALRHVVGSHRMDEVLSVGREAIGAAIQERLISHLTFYGNGLEIIKINLLKGNPPQQVEADFIDVVRAAEDKERMRNEAEAYSNRILPEARGEAKRLLEEATGYRFQVEAHARGEAARFNQQLAEYKKAPAVTRRRLYLETVEGVMQSSSKVLLDSKSGNQLLYLPLDQLVARSQLSGQSDDSVMDIRELIRQELRRQPDRATDDNGNRRRSRN